MWSVEEEFQKNKNKMRGVGQQGQGYVCGGEKTRGKKKKKRKGKETYGCKERK